MNFIVGALVQSFTKNVAIADSIIKNIRFTVQNETNRYGGGVIYLSNQ